MVKFMLLPEFILEEIFKYLDPRSLVELRRTCQSLHQIALPLLFRIHKLESSREPEYKEFLERRGKFFRGLIVEYSEHIPELRYSGLHLSSTFPNLRSISFGEDISKHCGYEELTKECLSLTKLRHVTILDSDEKLFSQLTPVFNNLNSLYLYNPPDDPMKFLQSCPSLKSLSIPIYSFDPQLLFKLKTESTNTEIIVVLDDVNGLISSTPRSNGLYYWIQYDSVFTSYLFRIPFHQAINNKSLFERYQLTTCFPGCFSYSASKEDITEIVSQPNLVDHCTIYKFANYYEENKKANYLLKDMPSLELDLTYYGGGLQLQKEPFRTTSLSLKVGCDKFSNFFRQNFEYFPNLQHFYIRNQFIAEMLPLKANCFPKLVHFYSEVPQLSIFWPELFKAAPNLLFIHSDIICEEIFDLLKKKPSLQVIPYRNIWDNSALNDVTGFNSSLDL
ncbi:hypothetical protein DSO57_1016179 [Entomophthora muscae]|uniref:Uncharacterized protein n=1 Tax=Entomophthora muscae TaxID=34485 RepID=A0ACC2TFR9_9FUNG|nr:hypothetical protein DSO57_1016179 [Entomophthora muscae]